jgi:hypothetical protein
MHGRNPPSIPGSGFYQDRCAGIRPSWIDEAGDLLSSSLCAEIEVQVVARYKGQALFQKVCESLYRLGLSPWLFRPNYLMDIGGEIEVNSFCTSPTR